MCSVDKNKRGRSVDIYDAVIVGAGWSGMYMLHRLRGLGLKVQVYEAGADVGGTWYWNRYPGARCDVPSLNYSYSFSEDIWKSWNWSERYAAQQEIEDYAKFVADQLDLRRDIQFNTTVTSARFDDIGNRWIVGLDPSGTVSTKYLMMGTGGYSAPITPRIADIGKFEGELLYTARWPRTKVSFQGKRVGVVGTGSSGIQVVTAIGQEKDFEKLVVFQRTANFAVPGHNHPHDPSYLEAFKRGYPEFWQQARTSASGTVLQGEIGPVKGLSDEEFVARMDAAWARGGQSVLNVITDLVVDPEVNERVAEYLRKRIRERVKDPYTAELLSPRGHYVGARRVLIENGYFETFNDPRVSLVDVRADPIERLTPGGLATRGNRYDLDMIIFATGFDSGTGALLRIDIEGRGHERLSAHWANGPRTYLGATIAGFPNLFVIAGPGSPSIRSNVIVSIEQHVNWITDLVQHMEEEGFEYVESSSEAEQQWTEHVANVAGSTLIVKNDTQYIGANVPGKPRTYLAYVGGVNLYRVICERVVEAGYEGFVFGGADGAETCSSREWSGPPTDPGLRTRFGASLETTII